MRYTWLANITKMRMNYWLMKTEPSTFSFDDLMRDKKTEWTGVRNYAARNHMRAMEIDDEIFIYHSMDGGKEIVGIAKVIKRIHPDSTDESGVWECVDIAPVKKLKRAVTLEEVKKNSALKNMKLVTLSRLSVQPVTEKEWRLIKSISET